jgi:hypothetical protein
MSKYLHIYGQMQWHGDAFILGNAEALKSLRDAIDRALSDEGKGSLGAYVNDGEGFYTAVVRVDNQETFDKLAVPYHDEIAQDHRDDAIWPEQMKSVQVAIQEQYDILMASRTPEEQAACDDSDRAAEIWEREVKKAQAVYNRLAIWDAQMIHSASHYEGMESDVADKARLVQLFFFTVR